MPWRSRYEHRRRRPRRCREVQAASHRLRHPPGNDLLEGDPSLSGEALDRASHHLWQPFAPRVLGGAVTSADVAGRSASRCLSRGGRSSGSSLDLMRKQHLDPNGVEIGMLIPLRWNPGSQRNLDFGVALTRAMNTWQVERWVRQEPRLRASVLVAQEDTEGAVAEIDARGGDPNFT